jgi:hypothetical protein
LGLATHISQEHFLDTLSADILNIRIPAKLAFKNPKFIVALSVTNNYPGGFWEDYGYNWFSGS